MGKLRHKSHTFMLLVINRSTTQPFNSLFSGNTGLSPYFIMPKLSRAFPLVVKVLMEPAVFVNCLLGRLTYLINSGTIC